MTKVDLDWAIGLNRVMLNLLGVWPSDYEDTRLRFLRIPFMVLWIFSAFFLPQLYALVKVYPDLTLIIDNVITSCACCLAQAKLFFIWKNRRVLEFVIRCVIADWKREKSCWERDLMLKQARRGRLFTMSGFAMMTSMICCFAFAPYIGVNVRVINNITDLHERRHFPMQTYYPYDFVASPKFELTYIAQLVALGFAGASFSAADNFFGVLVFHAAGQCEILSAKLTGLFDAVSLEKQVDFKDKLCRMVRMHVHLVQFVIAIEKSFNILIAAHTLCLSISMCCSGFEFVDSIVSESSKPPIIQIAMLTMSLANMMLHMLVYCTATEILTSNSEQFIQAIYDSNWYSFPAKYSADVIPLMMRSQYPLRLTVGKFFNLSLNFFAKILKHSAGFVSMLLAVR